MPSQGMKVFFMLVAAVYVLYLLFLVVRACSELRHMPYVGKCPVPAPSASRQGGLSTASHAGGLTRPGKTLGLVRFPRAGDQRLWAMCTVGPVLEGGRGLGARWARAPAWLLRLPGPFQFLWTGRLGSAPGP